jgi:hypothetical protein
MNIRSSLVAVTAVLATGLSACSSMESARHEYLMRGQVVEVSGKEAVVCVGKSDGAQAGQTLNAYKLVSTTIGGPAKNPPKWERVSVGSVRIVSVIDEHFAKAEVAAGDVQVNNLVELKKQ